MNRIPGILLSLFGILVTLLGLATTHVALENKRTEWNIVAVFLLMTAIGMFLVFQGVRSFRRAGKSAAAPEPERDDQESFHPDVLDRRQHNGMEYVVLYQPSVTGKEGRPASLTVAAQARTPTTVRFQKRRGLIGSAESWGSQKSFKPKTLPLTRPSTSAVHLPSIPSNTWPMPKSDQPFVNCSILASPKSDSPARLSKRSGQDLRRRKTIAPA